MTDSKKLSSISLGDGITKLATTSMLAVSMLSASSFNMDVIPLLRNGLMQNNSASRPESLPWEEVQIPLKRSTARALLKHAGKWAGNDLEKCFKEVLETRGMARY